MLAIGCCHKYFRAKHKVTYMQPETIKIDLSAKDFFPEMRKKVNEYFIEHGISRYADGSFYYKAIFYFTCMVSGYSYLIIRGDNSIADLWFGYIAYLVSTCFLVVSVAHDGSHNAVSKRRVINSVLAQTWNLLGMSRRIWEAKHHQSHHIHTNLPHADVDITENIFLRFSPAYTWRPWHRYQHIYAPLVYLLFGPFQIFVKDFLLYFSKRDKINNRYLENKWFLYKLVLTKLSFVTISFLIPLAVLNVPFVTMVVAYLLSISIAGFLMLLILAVPHLNETGVWNGPVPVIKSPGDWALVQVRTTADSSPNSLLLAWLTGGLHTHLVHHLFPHICHVHYRALTPVISSVLARTDITYHSAPAWKLLLSHFRALQMMGMKSYAAESIMDSNHIFVGSTH
jgi:linoleoyl-CoA desaturase